MEKYGHKMTNDEKDKAVYMSRSRVRVGRGSDDKVLLKHLGRSSNAKTAHKRQKSKLLRTDGRTDGPKEGQSGL